MADYWKSLPKKYCDFCKCWFADNKASVDFHERGLRHKGNVRRKLQDIQRKGAKQERDEMKYNLEMKKIESLAMRAFKNDISHKPQLARELTANTPLFKSVANTETITSRMGSRFGEEVPEEESTVLVMARERALDTIAKKFERKSKWLERKTAEGKTYYWNKETFETKWTEPKTGFLSLEEQKYTSDLGTPDSNWSTPQVFKHNPYGKWKTVDYKAFDDKMIDLQLPGQELPQISAPVVSEDIKEVKEEFKEKTVDSLKNPFTSKLKSEEKITFKKRKSNSDIKRNVRQRTDD